MVNNDGINEKSSDERSNLVPTDVLDDGELTSTERNGGTRSSPPRVGGTGHGEAQHVKARSASAARQATAEDESDSDAK